MACIHLYSRRDEVLYLGFYAVKFKARLRIGWERGKKIKAKFHSDKSLYLYIRTASSFMKHCESWNSWSNRLWRKIKIVNFALVEFRKRATVWNWRVIENTIHPTDSIRVDVYSLYTRIEIGIGSREFLRAEKKIYIHSIVRARERERALCDKSSYHFINSQNHFNAARSLRHPSHYSRSRIYIYFSFFPHFFTHLRPLYLYFASVITDGEAIIMRGGRERKNAALEKKIVLLYGLHCKVILRPMKWHS